MSIEPTTQTLNGLRIPNEPFERTKFIRLDKNENTIGFPEELVRKMLSSVTPSMIASYPEPFLLRKRLSTFLKIDEDRILLASGSDAAIKNCFETFVNKGDKLIRLNPTYAMVGVYAMLFGSEDITIGYDRKLTLNFEYLIEMVRRGAKLVYVANPNSPTGTLLSINQLKIICKEALSRDAVVLVDEAYYYFCDVTAFDILDEFENLVVIRTFSKAIGLASVRLGYVISSRKIIDWLSRWRSMYEINTFAQHCGCFILDHWENVDRYVKQVLEAREWFAAELSNMGLKVFESHANFVLVKYPKERILDTVKRFGENKILIKGGGDKYPLSETLRFSIGTKRQMKECLDLLRS